MLFALVFPMMVDILPVLRFCSPCVFPEHCALRVIGDYGCVPVKDLYGWGRKFYDDIYVEIKLFIDAPIVIKITIVKSLLFLTKVT